MSEPMDAELSALAILDCAECDPAREKYCMRHDIHACLEAFRSARTRLAQLELTEADREVLRWMRALCDSAGWMAHQRHDPVVRDHVNYMDRAAALIDRLITKDGAK